jgi:tetratricopeptide (TPR) repeat protein
MKNHDSSRSQVEGDRNQVIANNFGTAFANVRGNVFLNQPPPRALSFHQLPADISDFTGRTDEIETILGHLKRGETVAISAVAGMPGVGKSALAIHVAHRLAVVEFPDVQLYIDLRGANGEAQAPADVLAQWLRALGLDESSIPKDVRERSSVFRSLLSGKRAIVVLDNARDEMQVRPLLPGSQTCAAIVTSRRVLGALEGATVINLQVLPEPEALKLLERLIDAARVQQELEAAKEIVRICGQLPLAIRIVGGTLKTKRHWNLSEYAQRLADEKQRLSHFKLSDLDVRASFELSYRELTDPDILLFCHLGLLEGRDFRAELVGVLIAEEVGARDAIERLVEAQLLEAIAGNRFQFHDLIRVFAAEKLTVVISSVGQNLAKQRIVDWFIELTSIMHRLLSPVTRRAIFRQWVENRDVSSDVNEQRLMLIALDWFEQEQPHLLSALSWANDAERWDAVVSLASNSVNFFKTRSYWQNWENACLLAIVAARKIGDRPGQGLTLLNLANVYQFQNRLPEAIECYQQSLDISRELRDRDGEGGILNNLGFAYDSQNRLSEAIECYQQSLDISRELRDRHGEGLTLNNVGVIYRSQRRWQEAIECYQQSLDIKREVGDLQGEANTLNNLGIVYDSQNRLSEAIECYQQSLDICRDLGNHYGEGISLNNLGLLYKDQGQLEKAISLLQEALTKIPPEASEYQSAVKWLINAQDMKSKKKLLLKWMPLILFGGVLLWIVAGIHGTLIVVGIMLLVFSLS